MTSSDLKIAVAQLNLTVGDLKGNAEKIIAASKEAYTQGARLVLTPELSICGYPPEDLLLRAAFIKACDEAVSHVALGLAQCQGLHVVVGHPQGTDVRTKSTAIQNEPIKRLFCRAANVSPLTPSVSCPITKCLMSGVISRRVIRLA